MRQVVLNPQEFELIFRQIRKLHDHKNRVSPREVRRKETEYKLLRRLVDKFTTVELRSQEGFLVEFNLDRKELRALQALALQGRKILMETIIPGYELKIKGAETIVLKEKFLGYKLKAEKTNENYFNLLYKVERHI